MRCPSSVRGKRTVKGGSARFLIEYPNNEPQATDREMQTMTDLERYLFDLQGYLVVENVLTDADCDAAIAKITANMKPMDKSPDGYPTNGT